MSSLAAEFVRGIRDGRLLGRGDRVVAAVSGGSDSVALLHLLAEAAPRLFITLAGAVHLHHGLRGQAADEDLALVGRLCGSLGVPLHAERADVAALARASGRSIEAAGRAAREACYERARLALAATHVATGHTMEDQAETVLLRLARGAGVGAVAGIRQTRGCVVRPLLGMRRAALQAYLTGRNLPWREDASNLSMAFARNRVRHRVMPVLTEVLSPGVVEALARSARIAGDEDDLLQAMASEAAARLERGAEEADGALDRSSLLALPVALRRRVLHGWLQRASPGSGIGLGHVEAVLAVAASASPRGQVSLPGVTAVADGRWLRLEAGGPRRADPVAERKFEAGPRHLPVPGVLSLAGLDMQVSVERLPAGGSGLVASDPVARAGGDVAVVDAETVGEPLAVRFRRPGDRIRPLGMSGHRKLQDLLVDRKVPRQARDRVPLVVDAHDRIIWVAGHVIAADARVTPGTTRVLLLQLQRSGGVV